MISIIVPVYNVEKYVRRCIESIIAQTYTEWELILVDDGSPDKSGEICDEYVVKDKRIRVFHRDNDGVSSARNYGIDRANGEWLLFVDSDDWIEEFYLESFVKEKNGVDTLLIQGRINDKEDGSTIDSVVFTPKSYNNIADGIIDNGLLSFGAPYCKLYNKSIIQKNGLLFPKEYSYGEDTSFFLSYVRFIKCLKFLSIVGYHYICYEGANLSNKMHKTEHLLAFLNDSTSIIIGLDKENSSLQKEYLSSQIGLLKKSLISLYFYNYSRDYRLKLLGDVKNTSAKILNENCNKTISEHFFLNGLKYLSTNAIDKFLSIHFRFKNNHKGL